MNNTYIIENSPVSVLIGLFVQHIGREGIEDFINDLNTYKGLPVELKEKSDVLISLSKTIDRIIDAYNTDNLELLVESVFLINRQTLRIDRSLAYPAEIIEEKEDNLVKVLEEKTNLYFQKNALKILNDYPFTDDTRVVTVVKDDSVHISFTKEEIKGVSYKLSKGVSTNFNKKHIGVIEPGFYRIDPTPIEGEDKNIYYKLDYVKREK